MSLKIKPRYNIYKKGAVFLLVGGLFASLYAVLIHPMLNIEKYKMMSKFNRRNINQEDIQPGNMRIWSDPFGRK